MKKKVEVRLSHPEHTNMYLCEKCFCWDGEFYKKSTTLNEPMWLSQNKQGLTTV